MEFTTLHLCVVLNIIAYIFSAGVVWAKLKNLERIVQNGLSAEVGRQGKKIAVLEGKLAD